MSLLFTLLPCLFQLYSITALKLLSQIPSGLHVDQQHLTQSLYLLYLLYILQK